MSNFNPISNKNQHLQSDADYKSIFSDAQQNFAQYFGAAENISKKQETQITQDFQMNKGQLLKQKLPSIKPNDSKQQQKQLQNSSEIQTIGTKKQRRQISSRLSNQKVLETFQDYQNTQDQIQEIYQENSIQSEIKNNNFNQQSSRLKAAQELKGQYITFDQLQEDKVEQTNQNPNLQGKIDQSFQTKENFLEQKNTQVAIRQNYNLNDQINSIPSDFQFNQQEQHDKQQIRQKIISKGLNSAQIKQNNISNFQNKGQQENINQDSYTSPIIKQNQKYQQKNKEIFTSLNYQKLNQMKVPNPDILKQTISVDMERKQDANTFFLQDKEFQVNQVNVKEKQINQEYQTNLMNQNSRLQMKLKKSKEFNIEEQNIQVQKFQEGQQAQKEVQEQNFIQEKMQIKSIQIQSQQQQINQEFSHIEQRKSMQQFLKANISNLDIQKRALELSNKYLALRQIKKDGINFLRAISFAFLEHLTRRTTPKYELDEFINKINNINFQFFQDQIQQIESNQIVIEAIVNQTTKFLTQLQNLKNQNKICEAFEILESRLKQNEDNIETQMI